MYALSNETGHFASIMSAGAGLVHQKDAEQSSPWLAATEVGGKNSADLLTQNVSQLEKKRIFFHINDSFSHIM